jgi:hypothetical protein
MTALSEMIQQLSEKIDNIMENMMENIINNNEICCMCNKEPGKFMPIACFHRDAKYTNSRSCFTCPHVRSSIVFHCKNHKICENCWWDEEQGFALEHTSHKCPGCKIKKS